MFTEAKKETRPVKITRGAALDLVYTAMFSALICVSALITIPIGPVPFTLQTLVVCLAAGVLGWKLGTLSVIVYILIGFVGLPVFSGGKAGPETLFSMTGGYIIGFILTALIVGLAAERFLKKPVILILFMAVGVLACYALGTPWFMFVANKDLATSLGVCVLPFLIPDAVKIVFAALLAGRLKNLKGRIAASAVSKFPAP